MLTWNNADPVAWFVGQFVKFLLRPKPWLQQELNILKRLHPGKYRLILYLISLILSPQGQLITKCPFGVFISTKKPRNFFKDFCTSLKKEVKSKKSHIEYFLNVIKFEK